MTETSPADLRTAAQAHLRGGRFDQAAAAYRALVESEPNAPDLRYGLGAALSAAGDDAGAADAWGTARVFHGLALLRELGVDMERFAADPDFAAETGRSLAASGLPGVAAAGLARAFEALGPQTQLLIDYAVCLLHQGALEEAGEILSLADEADVDGLWPLTLAINAFADDGGLRRALLARQFAAALEVEAEPLDLPAFTMDSRPLRVGYVLGASPLDIRYLAVIANHDPERIEPLFLVETAQAAPEGFAAIPIGAMSDCDAARAVAALAIDVLVDLSGPSGGRLGVFALRPAPVQLAWNGDMATTGLTRLDAKLLPAGSIQPDAGLLFCEPLIEIGPVLAPAPSVEIAPRQAGRFTLGAFLAPALLTAPVVAAIAHVLLTSAGSRLLLKHPVMDDPVIQRQLAAKFLACGVPRERLDFRSMSGDDLDLFDFETVDLAVDSRPSMGESQILALLGQGVPVLVPSEPTTLGSLAAAPLRALGLGELVVDNLEQMATRAIELAADPQQLTAIRDRIAEAFAGSAYGDVRRVAADLEAVILDLAARKAGQAASVAA